MNPLQMAWNWLQWQIQNDWTGIVLFLIGSGVLALLIDRAVEAWKRRRYRRKCSRRMVPAETGVVEQATRVAAGAWRDDSGERDTV